MAERTVLVRPLWRLRSGARHLMEHPPQGYRFVVGGNGAHGRGLDMLARYPWSYRIQWLANSYLPLNMAKAYLNGVRAPGKGVDLVYTVMGLWFGRESWVLDMEAEQPHLLLGHERPFRWFRPLLLRSLRDQRCRRIICWVDSIKYAFLAWLDGDEVVAQKLKVIYWAVPRKEFVKRHDGGRVVLLFVDSAHINSPLNFHIKGGKEVLEAFVRLRRRYPELELVVRSAVPPAVAARYRGVPGLRIIDHVLPWPELEQEWQRADIFVHADHATPGTVYIDAMSYELPIVTTDVLGNRFLIDHGRTGMLVPKRQIERYVQGYRLHFTSPHYRRTLLTLDEEVVQGLVDSLSLLVENPELRRAMGRAARHEAEEGRFSLGRRNADLKQVLDEAIAAGREPVLATRR
ncbi:MAG: glycosyltransferase [Dehalococcoidia bacterium]